MITQEEFQQLLQEISTLRAEVTRLNKENQELRKENQELREENQKLRKEVEDLKEKLGTNSSNSSLPPSRDPNRKRGKKGGSGRKPGGQPGHQGHSRELLPPEQVQKFIDVLPESCPNCGAGTLETENPVSTEKRQQVELPEIKPEVTQYNIHSCRCGKCGKHVAASLPKEARRGFGPRLMGFLVILAGEAKATRRVIVRLLGYLGIRMSLGSVSNVQKLASRVLEVPYKEIKGATLAQNHVNADESGWKNRGQRRWIWVGATKKTVFFAIDPSRSQAAFKRVFGDYQNALTTDRYSAYNIHEGKRQACWSHLDRDFAKIAERPGQDGVIGRLLQEGADGLFGIWREFAQGEITRGEMREHLEKGVIPNVEACLKVGASAEGMNPKTQRTCRDLLNRFETLWLFGYHDGVEPTNNLAERVLRPAVIRRKISFGSQSDWGERFVERVLTVVVTFHQMAKNSYDYLTLCFQAWQRDEPIPSPF